MSPLRTVLCTIVPQAFTGISSTTIGIPTQHSSDCSRCAIYARELQSKKPGKTNKLEKNQIWFIVVSFFVVFFATKFLPLELYT